MAPAPSKIDQLPDDTIARIKAYLAKRRRSVDEFLAFLTEEIGLEIARSSAHYYQQKEEKVRQRLRQSGQMTEALGRELGEAALQGKQGRLLVEMARTFVFDFMVKLDEVGAKGLTAKDIADLGRGLAYLSQSQRLDQEFEKRIREEEREKAAKVAKSAAKKAGLSPEAIAQIEREVLGITGPVIEGDSKIVDAAAADAGERP